MGAQREVRIAHRNRDHRDMRRAFGVGFAAEALAVAAILTGAELRPIRIGIGARSIRGRARERVIAKVARGLVEHLAAQNRRQRRQRIVACPRRFERIPAGLDLALDVAGFAGDRGGMLELVVVGLELVVGDAPVLDRHVRGDEILAVALLVHGADFELHVGPAPGVAAPMHARAADHLARQERPEAAHRQRLLRRVVADRQRVARRVLHQVVANDVTQLVANAGDGVILLGCAHIAALERDDLEPGFSELLGQNAAGPAETDDHDIDVVELRCHVALPQLMSAMLTGSLGNGLFLNFSMFSRCTAIAPGKPISLQPALSRLPPWIGSENMPSITVWYTMVQNSRAGRPPSKVMRPPESASSTSWRCASVSWSKRLL